MSERLLLGIDVGTSGLKTVLMASSGDILASSGREYPTYHPHPGWAEHNPEDWWRATCDTIQEVLRISKADPAAIAGIATSGLAPTMLSIDKNGKSLGPAAIWADLRAEPQCEWLRQTVGAEKVASYNGTGIESFFAGPKFLWQREHDPEIYKQTYKYLQANSYINFRLSGVFSLTYTNLTMFLMADVRTGTWSEEMLKIFDFPVEKLPDIHQAEQIIGEVTREAAAETGLRTGIPVLAGTVDTAAAAVGVGSVDIGQCFVSMGTGLNLCLCAEKSLTAPTFICFPHAVPREWLIDAIMTSTGASLKWFRNYLGIMECEAADKLGVDPYELLTLEAGKSAPGSGGLIFLPYVMGELAPIYDSEARGVYFGISANTKKCDMVRAILEGTAMGLRQNLDAIEATGAPVTELRIVGGATKSALWNQIHADILDKPIGVPILAEGAPLGDAILAGYGVGVYKDIKQAAKEIGKLKEVYQPNPPTRDCYNDLRSIYAQLYPSLKSQFGELASFRSNHYQ
jgi:xylulokinase